MPTCLKHVVDIKIQKKMTSKVNHQYVAFVLFFFLLITWKKELANYQNQLYFVSQQFCKWRWLKWDLKWYSLPADNTITHCLYFKQYHYSDKATCTECFRFPGKLEATCMLSWTLQSSKSRSNTSLVLTASYHGFSSAGLNRVSSVTATISSSALNCLATWL